jgi:hypothetical protein
VHEIANPEAISYAMVWLCGALAALARTLRDSDYRDSVRAAGAVACGGFIAFSFVGILRAHFPGNWHSEYYSLAVASVVGLTGKSVDRYARALVSLVSRIKLPELDTESENERDES